MGEAAQHAPIWDFTSAPPHRIPGISSMVGYRGFGVPEVLHRGLPSSRLTFILALDDGVETATTRDALELARPAPVVVAGLHTAASLVQQRPEQAGIQLAMHPLAARALLGMPAAQLPVTDFDGEDVLGRWALELHEQLRGARDWETRFRLIEGRLFGRLDGCAPALRPELLQAWALLERSRGRLTVSALAGAVGLSPRHLGTLFRREVGRSPKQVASLMRFEHASTSLARAVRMRGRADLADLAAEIGFSDQAHLTREFTRYTGVGPGTWIREEFRNIQDGGYHPPQDGSHD